MFREFSLNLSRLLSSKNLSLEQLDSIALRPPSETLERPPSLSIYIFLNPYP